MESRLDRPERKLEPIGDLLEREVMPEPEDDDRSLPSFSLAQVQMLFSLVSKPMVPKFGLGDAKMLIVNRVIEPNEANENYRQIRYITTLTLPL